MDRERLKAIIREKCKNLYSVGFDFTKCEKVTLMVILGIPYKELWGEEF